MLTAFTLAGIPEIHEGAEIAEIIASAALCDPQTCLQDGDIVTISSKIISKAEGRILKAEDREDAITAETVRVVATREYPGGTTRIVENRLGIVGAAAGIDASNTPKGTILLLPVDPDASALRIRKSLESRFGIRLGVIVTDTLGRAWREGQTDVAIGASGVRLIEDLRGQHDAYGRQLNVTAPAVGDEIASTAELIKGKRSGQPVVIVRGLMHLLEEQASGGRILTRPLEKDMFQMGSAEAWQLGFEAGQAHVAT